VAAPSGWHHSDIAKSVLIVDDDPQFRMLARLMLERGGFHVVGEAGTGAEALRAVEALRPQLVLLDVQLPDGDGFAISDVLTASANAPGVVLCSSRDPTAYPRTSDDCGAAGYVIKSDLSAAAVDQLIAHI
jgi:DNA-binding NarL/FixJ family response regulator